MFSHVSDRLYNECMQLCVLWSSKNCYSAICLSKSRKTTSVLDPTRTTVGHHASSLASWSYQRFIGQLFSQENKLTPL